VEQARSGCVEEEDMVALSVMRATVGIRHACGRRHRLGFLLGVQLAVHGRMPSVRKSESPGRFSGQGF
jgi:hypothetical protein